MDRIRVGTLQYFVRPIREFDTFEEQVRALVGTGADYGCDLLVFPEYFTVQLLTLGDIQRPMDLQIRDLAQHAPRVVELLGSLARETGVTLVGGTVPVLDPAKPDVVYNDCHVFAPDGSVGVQGKLHMTRFEKEHWRVNPRRGLQVFDTPAGRMAIAICYHVEFPELARSAARQGAHILVVPSYTDDRQGFLRVRYCAQARAVENQIFVIHSATVGSLPMVPAVSLNYGQASILTPSDFPFARDGILAEGLPNQETMVIGELNLKVLRSNRTRGTVRPLADSRATGQALDPTVVVSLGLEGQSGPAPKRRIVIRPMAPPDFPAVRELARLIYPEISPWSDEQLSAHLDTFPQGQFVAVEQPEGRLVGSCSGLVIDWDRYETGQNWASFTSGGTYANHDPVGGRTLFAADVMVRPGMQGRGIGKRLYKAGRFELARQLGLKRVLAGARLRGYHRHAQSMSAEDYVVEVVQGRLNDPTLSFQLSQGFRVLDVVGSYFPDDPESLGWAAVIEWLNEDAAEAEDYDQGDPRYRPSPAGAGS